MGQNVSIHCSNGSMSAAVAGIKAHLHLDLPLRGVLDLREIQWGPTGIWNIYSQKSL